MAMRLDEVALLLVAECRHAFQRVDHLGEPSSEKGACAACVARVLAHVQMQTLRDVAASLRVNADTVEVSDLAGQWVAATCRAQAFNIEKLVAKLEGR